MLGSERGAGMIWWVIILVILVVVSGVLAYTFQTDLREAQVRIDSLSAQLQTKETDIAAMVSEFGELADAVGFSGETLGQRKPEITAVKARIGDINAKYADIQDSDATLEKLLVRFDDLLTQSQAKYGDSQTNLDTAQKNERSAQDLATSTAAEKDKTIEQLQADIRAEQNRASENAKKSQDTIDALRNQVSEIESRMQKLAADAKKEKNLLENQILGREAQIREMQIHERTVREKDTSDGQVVDVSRTTGIAYVDLGFRHGVKPGMRFRVFEYEKGGAKKWKGEVQIREVEETMSSANVLASPDLGNPVKKGDHLANPLFDRDKTPVFVFVGEMNGRYSRDEVTRLIQAQGAMVADRVTADTDFLVVGAKSDAEGAPELEATPEYVRAIEYKTDIISVRDLESMLRF